MSLKETWPYVAQYRGDESDLHIRLKGLAIYWLMSRGFDLSNIENEHTIQMTDDIRPGGSGRTDIYAKQDGLEVFVECETAERNADQLSQGGMLPAKKGRTVYVFRPDGIHLVISKTVTAEGPSGPLDRDVLRLKRISDLPMLDLSAYKG